MDIYEEAVLGYITYDRRTFAIPQFSIPEEPCTNHDWSCPDFVAICPPEKKCYIVEVSAASRLTGLLEKVKNKDDQWIDKLKDPLIKTNVISADWTFEIKLFVRDELIDDCNKWLNEHVQDRANITVEGLEITFTPWKWNWDNRNQKQP